MSVNDKKYLATEEDIPQSFTSAQMANIKANMPSSFANVNIKTMKIYSPEETEIGVWREYRTVEGQQVLMEKPVYIKTFTGISASGTYSIDISSLNIEEPISLSGYCRVGENGNYIFGGNWKSSATESLQYFVSNDKKLLKMDSGDSYIYGAYRLTLQYTKTTDEWEVVE